MKHRTHLRFLPALLVALALAAAPVTAHAAPAASGPAGAWAWFLDLPSLLAEGITFAWEQARASTDPDGLWTPLGVAVDSERASVDPAGQPAPLEVTVQDARASTDPNGQPAAGSVGGEGDVGHLIEPLG